MGFCPWPRVLSRTHPGLRAGAAIQSAVIIAVPAGPGRFSLHRRLISRECGHPVKAFLALTSEARGYHHGARSPPRAHPPTWGQRRAVEGRRLARNGDACDPGSKPRVPAMRPRSRRHPPGVAPGETGAGCGRRAPGAREVPCASPGGQAREAWPSREEDVHRCNPLPFHALRPSVAGPKTCGPGVPAPRRRREGDEVPGQSEPTRETTRLLRLPCITNTWVLEQWMFMWYYVISDSCLYG